MTEDRPPHTHAAVSPRPRVAVIGGGISGLATAYFLSRAAAAPLVTVIEASSRLGGKVLTTQIDGHAVDTGPDSLPARPALLSLLDDLGLSGAIVGAAPLGTYVWSRGKMRRLPPGTMYGVPSRLSPLLRSRLLSPAGVFRAGFDLVLPRQRLPADTSLAELLRPRFGREMLERLVEPLVGGMHAGRVDQLSVRSTVPDIDTLARENRSLYLALRRRSRVTAATSAANGGAPAPAMLSLGRGLGQLVAALADALAAADVRLSSPVTSLRRGRGAFRIGMGAGGARSTMEADAVVLATPAFVSAGLVESLSTSAAATLRGVRYVDVATVILTYPADAVGHRMDATGFLVPPAEGRLIVACSWMSAKWPPLSAAGAVVVRAVVGRAGDQRWSALDDPALIAHVHAELAEAMRLCAPPSRAHVQRWPRALPQYTVGHQDRLGRLDAALKTLPGLHITGAASHGAGVVGCISQAERCAAAVLARLPAPTPAGEACS